MKARRRGFKSFFLVMKADRRRCCDMIFAKRAKYDSARDLAGRMNRRAVEKRGPHGPLFYVEGPFLPERMKRKAHAKGVST